MNRKFIQFEVIVRNGESEFADEGTSRGYIDVNTIESFYESNEGTVIEMDSGNGFKVRDSLEFVLDACS